MGKNARSWEMNMPIFFGGLASFTALVAGILGRVPALDMLLRAGLAFGAGWFLALMWSVVWAATQATVAALPVESKVEESIEGNHGTIAGAVASSVD
jgi:hypothetical protein